MHEMEGAAYTIALACEASEVTALLSRRLSADAPGEVLDGLVDLLNRPGEAFIVESDQHTAGRAGEIVVRLKPSERLLELMAAAGASEGDF